MVKLHTIEPKLWVPPEGYRRVYPNYTLPPQLEPPPLYHLHNFERYVLHYIIDGTLSLGDHDKYFGTLSEPEFLDVEIPIVFGFYERITMSKGKNRAIALEYPKGYDDL